MDDWHAQDPQCPLVALFVKTFDDQVLLKHHTGLSSVFLQKETEPQRFHEVVLAAGHPPSTVGVTGKDAYYRAVSEPPAKPLFHATVVRKAIRVCQKRCYGLFVPAEKIQPVIYQEDIARGVVRLGLRSKIGMGMDRQATVIPVALDLLPPPLDIPTPVTASRDDPWEWSQATLEAHIAELQSIHRHRFGHDSTGFDA